MKRLLSLSLLVLICISATSQERGEQDKKRKLIEEAFVIKTQNDQHQISNDSLKNNVKDSTEKIKPGVVRIIQDERITTIDEYFAQRPIKHVGFRVQLTFGTREQVNKTKAKFFKYYPGIPIYEDFLPPNFRLRAGDFMNKLQAERFKAMINKHFPAAYIVKTRIEVPEKYKKKN